MTDSTSTGVTYDPLHDIAEIAENIALVLPTIADIEMENSNDFWTFSFTDESLLELLEKLAPESVTEGFLDSFHEHIGNLEGVSYVIDGEIPLIRMDELTLLNLGVWINRNTR